MKHFLLTCLLIFTLSPVLAQNDTKDSIAVLATVQEYENAWNKNDMDAVCAMFTEDASWINIGGLYWKNKNEITKAHHAFAPILSYMIPSKLNIQKIQFVAPGVAIVCLREKIQMNHALSFPDGREVLQGDIINDEISLVLVKKYDKWQIKAGHNTAVYPKMEALNPIK